MLEPPAVMCPPQGEQDLILRVEVRHSEIIGGKRNSCSECPVALALVEACTRASLRVRRGPYVTVQEFYASIRLRDGSLYGATLPWQATRFIEQFDDPECSGGAPFQTWLHFQQLYPAQFEGSEEAERFARRMGGPG